MPNENAISVASFQSAMLRLRADYIGVILLGDVNVNCTRRSLFFNSNIGIVERSWDVCKDRGLKQLATKHT